MIIIIGGISVGFGVYFSGSQPLAWAPPKGPMINPGGSLYDTKVEKKLNGSSNALICVIFCSISSSLLFVKSWILWISDCLIYIMYLRLLGWKLGNHSQIKHI